MTSILTDGQSQTYTVKAVNEYGSLSEPATINMSTGIVSATGEIPVTKCQYYNAQGHRLATPCKGLNIVVQQFADGSSQTIKEIH